MLLSLLLRSASALLRLPGNCLATGSVFGVCNVAGAGELLSRGMRLRDGGFESKEDFAAEESRRDGGEEAA
ncbi:hypothetical protein IWX91DRAFT_351102 [Phyllosticta citricarpa]